MFSLEKKEKPKGKAKNKRARMLEMLEIESDTKRVILMFVCFTTASLRAAFVRERRSSRQHFSRFMSLWSKLESDRMRRVLSDDETFSWRQQFSFPHHGSVDNDTNNSGYFIRFHSTSIVSKEASWWSRLSRSSLRNNWKSCNYEMRSFLYSLQMNWSSERSTKL